MKPESHESRLYKQKRNFLEKGKSKTRNNTPEKKAHNAFYHTSAWITLTKSFAKKYPICFDPFKYHSKANVVVPGSERHHIFPTSTHPHMRYTVSNLTNLCKRCHAHLEKFEQREGNTARFFMERPNRDD